MANAQKYRELETFIQTKAEDILGKNFSKVKNEQDLQNKLQEFLQREQDRLAKKDPAYKQKTKGLQGYIKNKGWESNKSSISQEIEQLQTRSQTPKPKKEPNKIKVKTIKEWETGIHKAETKKLGTKTASIRKNNRNQAYTEYGDDLPSLNKKQLRAWGFTEIQIKRIKQK